LSTGKKLTSGASESPRLAGSPPWVQQPTVHRRYSGEIFRYLGFRSVVVGFDFSCVFSTRLRRTFLRKRRLSTLSYTGLRTFPLIRETRRYPSITLASIRVPGGSHSLRFKRSGLLKKPA